MVAVTVRFARIEPAALGWDLLDESERRRAERKRDPDPFVSAHALLRRLVAEHDPRARRPADLRFDRRCTTCGSGRHGKPHVRGADDLRVSLSCSTHLAVAALCTGAEIGIDVEECASADFDGFDAITLDPDERPAFAALRGAQLLPARAQVWARKEAILKATGHGLVIDPTWVVVSGPGEPAALRAWRARQPEPRALRIEDLPTGTTDHAAALAVLTDEPVTIG